MNQPSRESEWAWRSRSFGNVARAYDRARPSYPRQLVDDVVAVLPGAEVVEVGAGTGKASELFVVRDVRLTCIEPDPQMAAVLKEKLPGTELVISTFEEWRPAHPYDGLIAGQAWHWTDPESRYSKAASALRENGVLALFWNHVDWRDTPLREAIDAVYHRHGVRATPGNPACHNPATPGQTPLLSELSSAPAFSDAEMRSYSFPQDYSAREWCDYLATTSDHLLVEEPRRNALLADIANVIDENGGVLHVPRRCDLYLARRA